MYDLVSIGSLTIDLYFQGENLTGEKGRFELAYGGKYFTEHFHESLGGGATNVAIGTRRLGLAVTLKTTIGDDGFRPFVEKRLQHERVSYIYSHFDTKYENISCILLNTKGEKTVINYRTPHQQIFSHDREKVGLLRCRAVFLGNLSDVSFTQKVESMRYFKSHKKLIFANFGVDDCRRSREQIHELLRYVDILIVNTHEFADLIKKPHDDIDFKKNVFHSLKAPELKALIVTQDRKGSHGYTTGPFFYQSAVEPRVITDSTGAGDGYTAGFIASYLRHSDIPKAMRAGAEYACTVLSKIGAT